MQLEYTPKHCALHIEKHLCVVGAGVIGLTTGIALLQSGFPVKIVCASMSPDTTSDKAAAFWLPFLSRATASFERWCEGLLFYKYLFF